MNFLWIYLGEERGAALMHVHVWEHIHCSQPLLQNRLMDVYELLMARHMHKDVFAQGRIQGEAK